MNSIFGRTYGLFIDFFAIRCSIDEKDLLRLLIWRSECPIVCVMLSTRLLPDLVLVVDQDVFHRSSKFVLLMEIAMQFLFELLLLALLANFLSICVQIIGLG